jgi:hypothetical protein
VARIVESLELLALHKNALHRLAALPIKNELPDI